MSPSDFHIELADYAEHLADLRAVREPVFIREQNCPPELEWDELDPQSVHVLARDASGAPIGTARLTPLHTIGRMAVLADWRGRGVGAALLQDLIERARALGHPAIELHAQTHAIGFYERFGFTAFGPEYDEAGIRHRSMRLDLGPTDERALRETDSPAQVADLTLELIGRARRELSIYTRDLDPTILDSRAASEALRAFTIGTRNTMARVLVHDLRRAVREGHALIALAQRLPSHFAIRVVEEEPDVQYAAAFVANDRGGYLFRPIATRFEASASLLDPARNRQLLAYFNEVWERARPASELRPL
ncbi:MAG TPA: GNAT family N-acetyltransferase [Chiayiivirga sp.]|nr:GNAT family N-acetyltransferase [Xanthomonadaceae bacterium]HMN34867.1 GNAT family N-acetyltransferase [Chiayiivirga sp.]